jgi:hypothetical protein
MAMFSTRFTPWLLMATRRPMRSDCGGVAAEAAEAAANTSDMASFSIGGN